MRLSKCEYGYCRVEFECRAVDIKDERYVVCNGREKVKKGCEL